MRYSQVGLELRAAEVGFEGVTEPLLVILEEVPHLCDLFSTVGVGLEFAGEERVARALVNLGASRFSKAALEEGWRDSHLGYLVKTGVSESGHGGYTTA